MGLLDKLVKKNEERTEQVNRKEEEYFNLVKVYIQAAMASTLHITNINMLPDLLLFKRKLGVKTLNGRLGEGEKIEAKKLLKAAYKLDDVFFTEIEKSIGKYCKKMQDINNYFAKFQGFSNDLLMLLSNQLQWKLRIPNFFRSLIKSAISDAIEDVFTKNDWDSSDKVKMSRNIRACNEKLGFSKKWAFEFIYPIMMIAKGAKL